LLVSGAYCPFVFIEIVEFLFVDTSPFVDEYFQEPGEHSYDWEGVLPRMSYISQLLVVSYNFQIQISSQQKLTHFRIQHFKINSIQNYDMAYQLVTKLKTLNLHYYVFHVLSFPCYVGC